MKRFASLLLGLVLLSALALPGGAVGTSAASAVLMEADSARVLYESGSHDRRAIASITKLMTALVALESGESLETVFRIPAQAVGAEGSSMYLREGEKLTLEALLYGLLLRSGNDAAIALALCCGGSVEAFVERMNERAAQLGMEDTHFENPNGLTQPGHYSSAYDMALLARACLENRELARIAATKEITIGNRVLKNHNKLLWQYEGCVGMKTGYTEMAGRTLVSAARREGMTLIAVTLNDPEDWRDHMALFDWGFEHFTLTPVLQAGETLGALPVYGSLRSFVPVTPREALSWPLGEGERLERELTWQLRSLQAPVRRGMAVGTLLVKCGEETVLETELITGEEIPGDRVQPRNLWERLLGWDA